MRIRAGHIILVLLALLTFFLLYVVSFRTKEDAIPSGAMDALSPPLDQSMDEAPMLELEKTEVDLGVIPHDRDTDVTVLLYNRGGSALEIRDTHSSCPYCTKVRLDDAAKKILPGQSVPLFITVSPSGIVGFESTKTVTLTSNDPRTPRAKITVTAKVDPEFTVTPDGFEFGDVQKGDAAARSIVLSPRIATPIIVEQVSLSAEEEQADLGDSLTFEIEDLPASNADDKKSFRITARLSPYMKPGEFNIYVFIKTNLTRFTWHRVAAHGTVMAPYSINFDQPGPVIILRKDDAVSIITFTVNSEEVDVEAHSEKGVLSVQSMHQSPSTWQVQCSKAPETPRGVHKDFVRIDLEVDGKTYGERIPFQIYVHGSQ